MVSNEKRCRKRQPPSEQILIVAAPPCTRPRTPETPWRFKFALVDTSPSEHQGEQLPSTDLGAPPRSAHGFAAQLLNHLHANMRSGSADLPPMLCGKLKTQEQPEHPPLPQTPPEQPYPDVLV